ncbi:hypothetical protein N7452_011080 [Penicillium brevicompactum]|uniref:Uncharacterized protein n=1 Tax=Penicillium brevicompactum TaxID=5074 RepID=A0A9W9Q5I1_PENBR|nr:hypothetical protein N7452_011080 [Penicillium brevicompactum]
MTPPPSAPNELNQKPKTVIGLAPVESREPFNVDANATCVPWDGAVRVLPLSGSTAYWTSRQKFAFAPRDRRIKRKTSTQRESQAFGAKGHSGP